MSLRFYCFATIIVLAFPCLESARAVTLEWTGKTFTSGQPNDYDADPDVIGDDITVAINTGNLGAGTMTAAVDTTNEGGFGANTSSLGILINLQTVGEYVTVTVTFSAAYTMGVTDVSFTLFDVDYVDTGKNNIQFQDQIRSITATTINDTTVGATVTDGLANDSTGTSPNQVINGTANSLSTGSTSSDGNVTIDFGTNAIKSFTFVYGSGTGLTGNNVDPTDQKIGIYNINFTPVPEINPAWSALVSCIVAGGLILRHRASHRK